MATQQAVADHLSLSRQHVILLLKKGVLPAAAGRAELDLDDCRKAYLAYLRGIISGRGKSIDGPEDKHGKGDYEFENTRLRHAQANHEELKVRQLRGELLPTQIVVQACQTMVLGVKARLLGIPSKCRSRCPDMKPSHVDQVDREIREALYELGETGIPEQLASAVEGYFSDVAAAAETHSESVGRGERLLEPGISG